MDTLLAYLSVLRYLYSMEYDRLFSSVKETSLGSFSKFCLSGKLWWQVTANRHLVDKQGIKTFHYLSDHSDFTVRFRTGIQIKVAVSSTVFIWHIFTLSFLQGVQDWSFFLLSSEEPSGTGETEILTVTEVTQRHHSIWLSWYLNLLYVTFGFGRNIQYSCNKTDQHKHFSHAF